MEGLGMLSSVTQEPIKPESLNTERPEARALDL